MTDARNKFDKAIWETVSRIASGRVMSYGEVARASGYPRHARMVSKAMSRSTKPLPWYRVVRSDRTLAFDVGSEPYNEQLGLLKKEGVEIISGKVVTADTDMEEDLDELLWGPPE